MGGDAYKQEWEDELKAYSSGWEMESFKNLEIKKIDSSNIC